MNEVITAINMVTAIVLFVALGFIVFGRDRRPATGFKAPRCEDRALLERIVKDDRQPPLVRRIAKSQLKCLKRSGK